MGFARVNTMAHTLGMSIQQHQQKNLLKFYVLPRAKKSRFPEKSSEKRLKKPWVKVQVHRICLIRQLASFCHASKNGCKKAQKSLKLLGFLQRHLFWCSLMTHSWGFAPRSACGSRPARAVLDSVCLIYLYYNKYAAGNQVCKRDFNKNAHAHFPAVYCSSNVRPAFFPVPWRRR